MCDSSYSYPLVTVLEVEARPHDLYSGTSNALMNNNTRVFVNFWQLLNHGVMYSSRLRVFENRILRRIFGRKKDENRDWRRLHNEELHSSYRSPNIARVIKSIRLRCAGHVARMEESRSAFKILKGTLTGKRPLGRPKCRWEDNIRMDLKKICINTRNWIDLAQKRDYWKALVNAALNFRVP